MARSEQHLQAGHGEAHETLEHAHPGAKTYTIVGAILAVITMAEVWAYTFTPIHVWLVPILLVLSATKFVMVVGFYMHLKFDHPLFTGVFGFGLAVAGSIITALLFLFHQLPHE